MDKQLPWLAVVALVAVTACQKKSLEDETEDVVKAQQEAAEAAVEPPRDTTAFARRVQRADVTKKAEKVIEEQKDVQKAMQEELKDKNIPPTTTTTHD